MGTTESYANNLYYRVASGGNKVQGLLWSSLKYGLRVSRIIEAIGLKMI